MDLLPLNKPSSSPGAWINSYPARLNREQAAACLDHPSLLGLGRVLRHARIGPLRSIADVYVPFRLYRVEVEDDKRPLTHLIAVDCVDGTLDPYRFDFIPDENKFVRFETRNALEQALEETKTREIASQHIRKETYHRSLLTLSPIRWRAELLSPEFYMPYWIGFFGGDQIARLRVLDGVSRQIQGAKARAFFGTWLLS